MARLEPPRAAPFDDLITERARVLRVSGNTAWVQCESQVGCARCAAGQGCGAGLFAKLLRSRLQELPVALPVEMPVPIAPGDWLLLGLPVSAVQNASLLLYGLPLAGLLLGAVAGDQLLAGDLGAFAGAVTGMASGLWLARRRSAAFGQRLDPVVLQVLAEHEPCPEPRKA